MSLHDLKTLILSHYPIILVDTVEEERAIQLLDTASEEIGLPIFEWSITHGLRRARDQRTVHSQTGDPVAALQHATDLRMESVFAFKDIKPHLEDPILQRSLRDACQQFRFSKSCLVLIGSGVELIPDLEHESVQFQLHLPTAEELGSLLDHTIQGVQQHHSCEIALSGEQRQHIIQALLGMTENQARQCILRAVLEDQRLDGDDIGNLQSMKAARVRDGGLLEFYPASENTFELGGFENLQAWLNRAALGFSTQAKEWNLAPPRGVLLTGVQGCGKSLAAKVIARQWQIPLLKLDAGQLFDKYIGGSEGNFRRAVEMAEAMAPCVLWIDEIEKAFSAGGDGSNDGGTSQRMLASFLTWMQEKRETVFVVATANNLERLPPEMVRKGRFDEIFFVDLPKPRERLAIWGIHLRLRKHDPAQFDLETLISVTDGFSGAEIEQAVISALYRALEQRVPLHQEHLVREIYETVPLSISRAEDVSRLRRYATNRFVPASPPEGDPMATAA